jgi:hypothetical protein
VPIVCVAFFPFGLAALVVRDTQRVVVAFDEPVPGRTRIVVHGTARRAVGKAFVNLGADAGPAPR